MNQKNGGRFEGGALEQREGGENCLIWSKKEWTKKRGRGTGAVLVSSDSDRGGFYQQ